MWGLAVVVFGGCGVRGWLVGWGGGEVEVVCKGRPAGKRTRLGGG